MDLKPLFKLRQNGGRLSNTLNWYARWSHESQLITTLMHKVVANVPKYSMDSHSVCRIKNLFSTSAALVPQFVGFSCMALKLCHEQPNHRPSLHISPKPQNEWTQIEHNMCGLRVAWSSLWWYPSFPSASVVFSSKTDYVRVTHTLKQRVWVKMGVRCPLIDLAHRSGDHIARWLLIRLSIFGLWNIEAVEAGSWQRSHSIGLARTYML